MENEKSFSDQLFDMLVESQELTMTKSLAISEAHTLVNNYLKSLKKTGGAIEDTVEEWARLKEALIWAISGDTDRVIAQMQKTVSENVTV